LGVFSDNARRLWECGYSVIPLNGKRPIPEGWNEFKDVLPTEEQIDAWELSFPDANIGLVTGPASGVALIDIDVKDQELSAKIEAALPPSPFRRFGAKGIGIVCRYSDSLSHQKLYVDGKHVGEVIVNTQFVLPPSIHPDSKKPYVWIGSQHLGNDIKQSEISDMPEITDQDIVGIDVKLKGNVSIEGIRESAGRNNKLKMIAGALIAKNLMPDEIANRLLVEDFNLHKNHPSGPLFKDRKEFGKLADQPLAGAFRFATSIFLTSMKSMAMRGEVIPQFDRDTEDSALNEFTVYRDFFNKTLKSSKKDIISKRLLRPYGTQWISVLENIGALKSFAMCDGLAPTKVEAHFDRYVLKREEELLIEIPEWDGVDRFKQLEEYVTLANQPWQVFEATLKDWGSGIFRRLYEEGSQNRCIILKGGQGIGKDFLLRSLFGAFGPYYSKFSSNRDEREAWSQVTSRLILHIEEFDQTGQLSVAFLKDLITRDWVTYRAPYGRDAITRKCYGSFISTVNIDAVLRDETGNRRFGVFEIEKIKWGYPTDWSPQILAQCHALYRAGFKADHTVWENVASGNQKFEQVDIVPELIALWDARVGMQTVAMHDRELHFKDIVPHLVEMRNASGMSQKALLTMLKNHGRSRRKMDCVVYFSKTAKDLELVIA
jgi:hypothetical protein